MNYTVLWGSDAERRLAELWLSATDQQAIADAADAIDAALSHNPRAAGESRVGDTRILLESPLGVYFDVSIADRTVFVWMVWRFR
jgi:hypothetical protein